MATVILSKDKIEKAFAKVEKAFANDELEIQLVTEEHYSDVLEFFREHFIHDEPINRSLEVEWDEKKKAIFLEPLKHNISLMAVSETGEIAGVRVIHVKKMDDKLADTSKLRNEKKNTIQNFLSHADNEIQFHKRYGVSEVWHFFALGIHKSFRRRGIGTKLMNAGVRLGQELGYKAIKGEGTSNFSQRIYEQLEFELLAELLYDEYKVDGKVVFKDMGEHKSTRIYGMQL